MRIIKSILSVQFIKLFELALPIIIIPKIINYMGLSSYGEITLFLSMSAYLILIGDWGFNINAVSYISEKEECHDSVKKIFFEIQLCKAAFISLFVMILFSVNLFIGLESSLILVFLSWIGTNILHCRWYFQAKYNLVVYAVISLISKLFILYYVFQIMNSDSDIYEYLLVMTFSNAAFMLLTNYIAIKDLSKKSSSNKFKLSLRFSDDFKSLFGVGWALVSSRILSSLFNPALLFFTGSIFGTSAIGFIGVCQKIISGIIAILSPITEVTFPKLVSLYASEKQLFKVYVKRILGFFVVSYLGFILVFSVITEEVFDYFNVIYNQGNSYFFFIYSGVFLFSLINTLLVNILVIKNMEKVIVKLTVLSMLSSLLVFYFTYLTVGIMSVALTFISQQIIASLMISFVINRK